MEWLTGYVVVVVHVELHVNTCIQLQFEKLATSFDVARAVLKRAAEIICLRQPLG